MPLYEYKCDSCGYQFETRQSFNDDLLTVCPNCGKPALRRLIEPASIVFKGSGFYVNDHKGSGGAARNTKKEDGDAASESAKPESTESKTAEPAAEAKSNGTDASSTTTTPVKSDGGPAPAAAAS